MKRAIWWVRRDLRLRANAALGRCVAEGGAVTPVFILDPAILEGERNGGAERRTSFLFGGLRALDASLRSRRGRLIVRQGRPATVLRELLAESGADMVCAEEDFSPYARTRDEAVAREVPLRLMSGVSIHDPREVVKRDGSPYSVFTPFSRAWQALPFPDPDEAQVPENLNTPADLVSLSLPEVDAPRGFTPGEHEARRRLACFLEERIAAYRDGRNRLDLEGTSALSPYFRFGMISVREAAGAARTIDQAQTGIRGRRRLVQ